MVVLLIGFRTQVMQFVILLTFTINALVQYMVELCQSVTSGNFQGKRPLQVVVGKSKYLFPAVPLHQRALQHIYKRYPAPRFITKLPYRITRYIIFKLHNHRTHLIGHAYRVPLYIQPCYRHLEYIVRRQVFIMRHVAHRPAQRIHVRGHGCIVVFGGLCCSLFFFHGVFALCSQFGVYEAVKAFVIPLTVCYRIVCIIRHLLPAGGYYFRKSFVR